MISLENFSILTAFSLYNKSHAMKIKRLNKKYQ